MKKSMIVSVVLAALMLSSAAVTRALTPTVRMADAQGRFSLEQMVPRSFGEWQVDTRVIPLQVDPATQAKLDKIYNQTLGRTYVNRLGERIMLSIAYGGDQGDNMGVHKPEVCYTAQGFTVRDGKPGGLDTGQGVLPVKRLFAVAGARQEPITYWITIGRKATMPGVDQRLQELRYGLSGTVPDGMLVRVSSIGADPDAAYALQDQFVRAMLAALERPARERLAGVFGD
ncbi:exosortase-associated protein EpsI, B-type [Pseudoduganella violaceinigra]|uniref:exosortase-associated protein EpsI, B-type n=1 Tax=Pseudoduganella violaceinigra TaxID=246602 RepID=UPI000407B437|nr:exosortase-associated protein EpsI, B-type [Pseudoduganella violaceinigra]